MPLLTTTIGSYPKPDDVPVVNWFDVRKSSERWDPTLAYDEFLKRRDGAADAALDRGTQDVVRDQVEAGIDIPTDGEVRREHYIYYHCRHLDGFNFVDLTLKSMRSGSWTARVPTVTGPIRAGAPFLPQDWRIAQAVSERPVKITVPGPLTIIDSTADAHYHDERRLAFALAEAINQEIRALAAAGCRWIQIDEPVFARYPERALEIGAEALARCFHGIAAPVKRAVHICCGYPSKLDLETYPKADNDAYFRLAEALERAPIDAISLEDAHRHNDLALLERFPTKTIILGVIAIARTRIEPVEAIRARLQEALHHIDPSRLIAAPDCGMIMLDRQTARRKLEALASAARSIG